jgi:hypothetical protein
MRAKIRVTRWLCNLLLAFRSHRCAGEAHRRRSDRRPLIWDDLIERDASNYRPPFEKWFRSWLGAREITAFRSINSGSNRQVSTSRSRSRRITFKYGPLQRIGRGIDWPPRSSGEHSSRTMPKRSLPAIFFQVFLRSTGFALLRPTGY